MYPPINEKAVMGKISRLPIMEPHCNFPKKYMVKYPRPIVAASDKDIEFV